MVTFREVTEVPSQFEKFYCIESGFENREKERVKQSFFDLINIKRYVRYEKIQRHRNEYVRYFTGSGKETEPLRSMVDPKSTDVFFRSVKFG